MELADKKCEACEGGVEALKPEEAMELGLQAPRWKIEEKRIHREFKFPDFASALQFANAIAEIAEKENHHPDLHISWGKVAVELSTHAVDGLSSNDFIMAAKIDRLADSSPEAQAI